jgi:hypothetical protein
MKILTAAALIALSCSAAQAQPWLPQTDDDAMSHWLSDPGKADKPRGKVIEERGCSMSDDAHVLPADAWELVDGAYIARIAGMWWPIAAAEVFTGRDNPLGQAVVWAAFSKGWLHICGFAPGTQT